MFLLIKERKSTNLWRPIKLFSRRKWRNWFNNCDWSDKNGKTDSSTVIGLTRMEKLIQSMWLVEYWFMSQIIKNMVFNCFFEVSEIAVSWLLIAVIKCVQCTPILIEPTYISFSYVLKYFKEITLPVSQV